MVESGQFRASGVPAQYAGLAVPVSEDDTLRIATRQFEAMRGRSVRVAMHEDLHRRVPHGFFHSGLIDVHDLFGLLATGAHTLITHMLRQRPPSRDRQCQEYGSCSRVVDKSSKSLIFLVVRTQGIAMQKQHPLVVQVNLRAVVENADAGFRGEAIANQKIAVSPDKKAARSRISQFPQRRDDATVVRVRFVISDPGFEQITEYVERVCLNGLPT